MNSWFITGVQYNKTLENGRDKKVTELYLVDALSFTEAEARIIEEIKPFISGEFNIVSIKREKISEVIFNDSADSWFKVKFNLITLDEKSGQEKKTSYYALCQADDVKDANSIFDGKMKGTMADYEVESISETKIVDVFKYEESK